MAGRERLHAGDPRNDGDIEFDRLERVCALENADRAVVETGIAPDEKCADSGLWQRRDQFGVDLGEGSVPVVNALQIGLPCGEPLGHGKFHDGGGAIGEVAAADLATDRGKPVLCGSLGGDEDRMGTVHGVDRLDRHMLGVTRSYADDLDMSHGAFLC